MRGRAPAHAIFQKNRTSHVRTRAIFSYDQNSKSHAKSQFSHKITRFFSYSFKFGPVLENIIIKSIQMNFRFDQKTDFHLIRHTIWWFQRISPIFCSKIARLIKKSHAACFRVRFLISVLTAESHAKCQNLLKITRKIRTRVRFKIARSGSRTRVINST